MIKLLAFSTHMAPLNVDHGLGSVVSKHFCELTVLHMLKWSAFKITVTGG